MKKAKQLLLEQASERELHSYTSEVRAKPQYHKYLIGKSGANINRVSSSFIFTIINTANCMSNLILVLFIKYVIRFVYSMSTFSLCLTTIKWMIFNYFLRIFFNIFK